MRVAFLAMAGILAGSLASQSQPAKVKVGDPVPDFEFPAFLNGDGRQKLSEFAGQPVLIEYWGTR